MWRFLKDKRTPDTDAASEALPRGTVRITGISGNTLTLEIDNQPGVLTYDIYGRASMFDPLEYHSTVEAEEGATTTYDIDTTGMQTFFFTVKTGEKSAFIDGEDYSTIWNQSGIAWHELIRGGNPSTAYVYLSAKFDIAPVGAEYQTSTLTLESYHGVSQFPFYVYKEGAPALQMAYEHLSSKMDRYFKTGEKRLIESYSDPFPGNLEGVAFTYDTALAISAYLARPTEDNLDRAKLLVRSIIWAQQNDPFADGRIREAYYADQELTGPTPPIVGDFDEAKTGIVAWCMNALAQYYKNSGDTDAAFLSEVLASIELAGEFIHTEFHDPALGGYYYGFYSDGVTINGIKSTEHNIAAYVAFSHLYDLTGNAQWQTRANNIKTDFLDDDVWIQSEDRYAVGVDVLGNPDILHLASDVNLLAVLALGDAQSEDILEAIEYSKETFESEAGVGNEMKGIDFGYYDGAADEPDGIWFEGTVQLAQAYKIAGHYRGSSEDDSEEYLESIKLAQYHNFNPVGSGISPDYKGIPSSSDSDGVTTGLGWSYYATTHIAPTAWFVATELGYNMLWGTNLDSDVPLPGSNESFTADAGSLVDDNEYISNHFVASGWGNGPNNMYVDPRNTDTTSGSTCVKIHHTGGTGNQYTWNSLVWQEPENEWSGGPDKGYDLTGATKLKFSIKASRDNFMVMTYLGNVNDSCGRIPFHIISPDPGVIPEQRLEIGTSWQEVEIDLAAGSQGGTSVPDMTRVSNGFSIVFDGNTPTDIYIDDIRYDND